MSYTHKHKHNSLPQHINHFKRIEAIQLSCTMYNYCTHRSRSIALDCLHNIHALTHIAKHTVLAVQVRGSNSTEKKLRPIGVGSSIGHGQNTGPGVLKAEVLIVELAPVDGLATCPVEVREISALAHEVSNDTMEGRP